MLALAVFPSASHSSHLVLAIVFPAVAGVAAWLAPSSAQYRTHDWPRTPLTAGEWTLALSLVVVVATLLIISVFLPLRQNDSLEYATVARILFETRTLASYPVLDPEQNAAGFFGPWTHPPLYVAAMYLVEVIQGHASSPGAIRLIAPWFAIAATAVVYSLGNLVGRGVGLVSALFFLSTPLLFLGAGSALLDALYVAAFALLVAALIGLRVGALQHGAIVGAIAGIGLWTHSVAILFIPLGLLGIAILRGISDLKALLQLASAFIIFSLLLGGWYYYLNTVVFGSPISDNPLVFALPNLHWDDYFVIGRGLSSAMAMLQYGILKGWFVPEAFGFTYWAMTVGGAAAVAGSGIATVVKIGAHGIQSLGGGKKVVYISVALLVTYVIGTVASVALGLDLMVKNERYLLSIQSVVAILAGFGSLWLTDLISSRIGGKSIPLRSIILAGMACIFSLQAFAYLAYSLQRANLEVRELGKPFNEALSSIPDYQLTDFLRDQTPKSSLVFSLRPSDMYYSERKMVSYLDPRLVPFYETADEIQGLDILKKLGISYVHVPSYGLPSLYNSSLTAILRNPRLTSLAYSSLGGQIYELVPSDLAEISREDITPGLWPWYREHAFSLGGRKRLGDAGDSVEALLEGNHSTVKLPLGLFQRHVVTRVKTAPRKEAGGGEAISVVGLAEIGIDIKISGRGLFGLRIEEYDSDDSEDRGIRLRENILGSFELSTKQPSRWYSRRLSLLPTTRSIVVIVEQHGESEMMLESVQIARIAAKGEQ